MVDPQRFPGFWQTIGCSTILALVVVMPGLPSCSDEGGTPPSTEAEAHPLDPAEGEDSDACLWEKNELLSRVDAAPSDLADCGILLGEQPLDNECFRSGLEDGMAVEITINNCIDCMIHSTYVSMPGSGKFHLYREADYYGDDVRVVRVESCTDFGAGQGAGANCVGPTMLYACSDPLPDPSEL